MEMLELKNIRKSYNGKRILDNVSYIFKKNKCYLIHGESGIGKSTLLNLIAGYEKKDKGEIIIDENLKIDYMFQDELLFSNMKVIDNLQLKYYANHRVNGWNSAMFQKNVLNMAKQFEIENLLEKKVSVLSGGERQRILLTNMMLSEAEILLMDEPVSKLDEKNRKKVISCIEKCLINKTVIIVSHDVLNFSIPVQKLNIWKGMLYEE